MFEDSLVESKVSGAKKTATVLASALIHVGVVALLIVVPLLVTDALPAGGGTGLGGIMLAPGFGEAAPAAPPPPPGGPATRASSSRQTTSTETVELAPRETVVTEDSTSVVNPSVVQPWAVPERMASLAGEGGEPGGVDGGVHGGVIGGKVGGEIGGDPNGELGARGRGCAVIGCGSGGWGLGPGPGTGGLGIAAAPPPAPVKTPAVAPPTPPPPPKVNVPEPPKVVRVAQELLQASCIKCPSPEYPPLAKISRVTDTVVLSARINKQGKIEDLTVVRGHTLLRDAAVNAIRGWVYRPTMMNGEPVEVQTTISISFVFRQ